MWDLSGSVRGTVTLSCPPMLAQEVVAPLLVDFCSLYPLVDLKLILKNHVPDFLARKVDISLQITDAPDPSTVARKLASVRWLICGSPAYLAGKPVPASPADLAGLEWVDQFIRDYLELDGGDGVERVKIHTRLECIDLTLLRRALVEGLGVGVLPDYVAQSAIKAGRLRALMTDYAVQGTPGTNLYAITPPTRYMPSKVKVLLDFIAQAFSGSEGSLAAVAEGYAARAGAGGAEQG
jgi:DNA-binding transcriptional LysR family regulator